MMQMEIRDHMRRFSENPNVWFVYRRKNICKIMTDLYRIETQ